MFPKRFQNLKTGFQLLSSMNAKKYLKKIGLEKEDYFFLKEVGKGLLFTYTIMGAVWLYNGGSLPGWSTPKPPSKEEQDLADNQRWQFPYHGDLEAPVKEFIAKRGMIGTTTNGPKGMVENVEDAQNHHQRELEGKEFEQEAQKMWLRMRNEVVAELQEKGFDVN